MMTNRITTLLVLLAIGMGVAGCGTHRSQVWLWPPAVDVADP